MSWFMSCAKGGGQRGEPEYQQVDLVGEAAAEPIAEKAGGQRADGHADEGQRDELQILRQRRELGLDCGREDAARDVEVIAVKEHAGADKTEDVIVKRSDRQAV